MTAPENFDDDAPSEPAPIIRPVRRRQAQEPERSPPHSAEAEEHVIACCLLDGSETIERAIHAGIKPSSFYLPANSLLFEVILACPRPVGLEILVEELKTRGQLEAIGGFPYLMQITGNIHTTAHAGYFIEKVKTLSVLRDSIKAHTQAVEDAYSFTGDLEEYLQIAKARVEAVTSGVEQTRLKDLEAKIEILRVTAAKPPKEPVTRLFLADKPIATSGNLVTIISRAKTGKTTALGAIVAAIIVAITGTQALDHDTFKFRASNPAGHAVIVIDTEQSPYDAFLCYQRSLKRAHHEDDPKWLLHYSLVGYSPNDIKQAIDLLLAKSVREFGGVFMVILDGVADLVASVNDEAESNALVTWLRARTVTYDCPAVCVIHSNEAEKSGDDGRGHLGKQLIRKAESNLLLKKDGEITTITSDKQRKAPITKSDNVAFRWSEPDQMHVSCDTGESAARSGGRKRQHNINEFLECIPAKGQTPLTGSQIHRFVSQISEIKQQTFKDLLSDAARDGTLIQFFDKKTGYSYTKSV